MFIVIIIYHYLSWTGDWILMILIDMIGINDNLCSKRPERNIRVQ